MAWVAADANAVTAAELRAWLRSRLPEYMVPSAFVVMPILPQNANGKVDRKRLPDPAPERPAEAAPRSAMERTLAGVWQEVLQLGEVGLDDNFFEIGGHSMLVARMQERLSVELEREMTVVELFQFPTIAALSAHLDASARTVPPPAAGDAPRETAPAEATERGTSRREMMRRQRAR